MQILFSVFIYCLLSFYFFLSFYLSILSVMKRSTACGPAAKGRRVSSFCCVWCRGLSRRWFDCVNLMHVCGLLLHGISGISTLPRGVLKCTSCLFVTFRVNFTSVLLHHEHLGYKLTLSVANTFATFCSIHLALPMEVWMTTSNSYNCCF